MILYFVVVLDFSALESPRSKSIVSLMA